MVSVRFVHGRTPFFRFAAAKASPSRRRRRTHQHSINRRSSAHAYARTNIQTVTNTRCLCMYCGPAQPPPSKPPPSHSARGEQRPCRRPAGKAHFQPGPPEKASAAADRRSSTARPAAAAAMPAMGRARSAAASARSWRPPRWSPVATWVLRGVRSCRAYSAHAASALHCTCAQCSQSPVATWVLRRVFEVMRREQCTCSYHRVYMLIQCSTVHMLIQCSTVHMQSAHAWVLRGVRSCRA